MNPLAPYAAVAALAAVVLLQAQCHRADEAVRRRDKAVADADGFRRQAELNRATGQAAQRAQAIELRATLQAKEAAHAVTVAPGGDEPLPPAVLELWSGGIDRLRAHAAAGDPDGRRPADASGELSETR